MEFTLSDEQYALQNTVRRFAETELPDIARRIEEQDQPPGHDLLKRYAELGFLGVNLPTEYGGLGGSHLDAVLVLEEIAKISIVVAMSEPNAGSALTDLPVHNSMVIIKINIVSALVGRRFNQRA